MKNFYKISVLLMMLFSFVLCSCKTSNKQITRMQKLEENVSNPTTVEELQDAIKKYSARVEDVVSANAQIGVWYKLIATRYVDKKMYGEALKNYQKAIEFYPTNQNLYYWVGVCAAYKAQSCLDYDARGMNPEQMNYYNLSESAYLEALKIDPRFVRAMYGISVLYVCELDESEKAIPYLEKLLTIDTKNTEAMMLLARAYYMNLDFEKAIDMYDKVLLVSKSDSIKADATNNKKFILDSYGN